MTMISRLNNLLCENVHKELPLEFRTIDVSNTTALGIHLKQMPVREITI